MSANSLKVFHPLEVNGLQRLGNRHDGGYVVHYPSLKDADYLISYGIGHNIEFEKDFFLATGLPTLAFDPTLRDLSPALRRIATGRIISLLGWTRNYVNWILTRGKLPNFKIEYVKEGISAKDNVAYKSLAYHFKKYGLTTKKIILKFDVEGSEYPILNDPSVYNFFGNAIQLILEFHTLSKHMEDLIKIMKNLSKTHSLIHIHANNYCGTFDYEGKTIHESIEATFLLNEYLPERHYTSTPYPVTGLDQPCNKHAEDKELDFFY